MDATTVAVDVAKNAFEVVIANRDWHISERHRFSRTRFLRFLRTTPRARVVMEACATAHYWGRLAQDAGHTVVLLPAAYVRPYVRRNKTDRTDAEALLEALRSGQLPAVPVKRVEQQAMVALHRVREQWKATRTARINALRALLAEHGVVRPVNTSAALTAAPTILSDAAVPVYLRHVLALVHEEIRAIEGHLKAVEGQLRGIAAQDPVIQRLRTIPGVGLLTATALVGSVGNIHAFRRGRQFASWLGLTPSEYSSGSRRSLGGITKRGDRYLRCLLTHGARAVLATAHRYHHDRQPRTRLLPWAVTVQHRRGTTKPRSPSPTNSVALSGRYGRERRISVPHRPSPPSRHERHQSPITPSSSRC
jgi:transposase